MCFKDSPKETRKNYFFVLGFFLSFLGFLVVSGFCCIAITSSGCFQHCYFTHCSCASMIVF
jgi:hypothetical protein